LSILLFSIPRFQAIRRYYVRISLLIGLAAVVAVAIAVVPTRAQGQSLPAVGQVAPTFTLPSQDGTQISLASFHGKWVVLYFYPKDMTPGCTLEAHNFQRDLAKYEADNAVILGVSVDSTSSHEQFCTKEGLSFRLLSDPAHSVVQAYGSLGSFMGITIANRNTFLIDPSGKIAKVWTKVSPSTHSAQVLAFLSSAEKGSVSVGGSVKPPVPSTRSSVKPPVPSTGNSVKPPQ